LTSGGRKLRNLKAAQVVRAFERLGYVVVRTKGSHHVLKRPDGRILVIPVHRGGIKTGIIVDALKKSGITIEEFEKHL